MRTLSIEEKSLILGGKWQGYVDGACTAVGVAVYFIPAITPVAIACTGWGVARAVDLI